MKAAPGVYSAWKRVYEAGAQPVLRQPVPEEADEKAAEATMEGVLTGLTVTETAPSI